MVPCPLVVRGLRGDARAPGSCVPHGCRRTLCRMAGRVGAMDDLELVRGLVEIPSVSRHEGDAVEWLVARMAERGFRASGGDAGNALGGRGGGARRFVPL